MKCNHITKREWRNETAHSSQLFVEADRLNDIAYGLLNDRPTTADTIKKFQIAKDAANAKYDEAHRAWKLAKDHLVKDTTSVLMDENIKVVPSEETLNTPLTQSKSSDSSE